VKASPGTVLRPDDVLSVTGEKTLTLAFGDEGAVRIEVKPSPPEVVERVVEKTKYVNPGPLVQFEVDNEVVDRGLVHVSRSLDTMKSSWRSVAGMAQQTYDSLKLLAPPEPPRQPMPEERQEATVEPDPSAAPPPARPRPPVLIRRTAGELTLQTTGQAYEVIPTLIGFLEDDDPDLVEMVRDRLEDLRRQLDMNPALTGTLELEPARPAEDPGALDQLKSLFRAEEQPAAGELTEAQRWNRWWQRNAVRILEAETYGTL